MAINLAIAVTNRGWFEYLSAQHGLAEVNFWSTSAHRQATPSAGELLLFKLKKRRNKPKEPEVIAGYGVFAFSTVMPITLAWEAFGRANGAPTFDILRARILESRDEPISPQSSFDIGCRILTEPVFWPQEHWLRVPPTWSPHTVTMKKYSLDSQDGSNLWEAIQERLLSSAHPVGLFEHPLPRYGAPSLVQQGLGQGGFRLLVTGLYEKRCAVTRERTLPALEAAHIRPFADGGEHAASNGILLRRDIHSLFDAGYVTVTPKHEFEVSRRIKEEFENGKDYYALHGREVVIPKEPKWQPDKEALQWHNETRFLG